MFAAALPEIQIYASIECPYAYLATYRLRQAIPEFEDRLRLVEQCRQVSSKSAIMVVSELVTRLNRRALKACSENALVKKLSSIERAKTATSGITNNASNMALGIINNQPK